MLDQIKGHGQGSVESRPTAVAAVDGRVDLDAQQFGRGLGVSGDLANLPTQL